MLGKEGRAWRMDKEGAASREHVPWEKQFAANEEEASWVLAPAMAECQLTLAQHTSFNPP